MSDSSHSDNFDVKLHALRNLYVRDLNSKIDALGVTLEEARRSGQVNDLQLPKQLAHSLASSAQTFGFPEVMRGARLIEQYLCERLALDQGLVQNTSAAWKPAFDALQVLRQATVHKPAPSPVNERSTAFLLTPEHGNPERALLLIEENSHGGRDLSSQFGYLGYQVESIAHGQQQNNCEHFIFHKPRAILIDTDDREPISYQAYLNNLGLPHAADDETPIIFLCNHNHINARLAALRAGGSAFFNKPVDVGVLIDAVDRLTRLTDLPPLRVMIVEDQEHMARFYASVLRQGGFEVRVVLDAMTVLENLEEFEPDLLLIDMYMPYCSGTELAQIIRQQEAFISVPIVYLSAETDVAAKLEAMRLGGDDFISKPVDPSFLISTVRTRTLRHQHIRQHIVRDGLTGLLNHTRFKEQINIEITRARRLQQPLSLAMIDIDHFKHVNDTYGHPAGDRVLRLLSRFLERRLRCTDVCGRFGGEEFGVLLTGADAEQAAKVMDALREDFSQLEQTAEQQAFHVTFSCGIADLSAATDTTQLIRQADRALYRAKHGGRNQVRIATLFND